MKSHIKLLNQLFPVVPFIRLYKVVITFESVDEIVKNDHSNKADEHYFPVILNKVIPTITCVDEILKCAVFPCDAMYSAVQGASNFCLCT